MKRYEKYEPKVQQNMFIGQFEKYRFESYRTTYNPETFAPIRVYNDGTRLHEKSNGSHYWEFSSEMTPPTSFIGGGGKNVDTTTIERERASTVTIRKDGKKYTSSVSNRKYLLIG
jgi:hypothetical protein